MQVLRTCDKWRRALGVLTSKDVAMWPCIKGNWSMIPGSSVRCMANVESAVEVKQDCWMSELGDCG